MHHESVALATACRQSRASVAPLKFALPGAAVMSSKHTWHRGCASVLRRALKEQVDLALKGLELRPRNILRYRYGLHHALGRALTLNEVRTRACLQCRNCLLSIAYPAIQLHTSILHNLPRSPDVHKGAVHLLLPSLTHNSPYGFSPPRLANSTASRASACDRSRASPWPC